MAVKARSDRLHTGSTGSFHQEQGRRVIVFDGKTVDLADLLSGKYGLHGSQINADQAKQKNADRSRPPARPPLHQLSVFPGYLIYIFNKVRSPEKFSKKILEQAASLFQKKRSTFLGYIVIAAR